MNWKLILLLSLFGLAMALATIWFIPSHIEPLFWLAIFIICAYLIAKYAAGRYFLHGLLVSLLNSVWITSFHILFFDQYILNHASEADMMNSMPMPLDPKLMMLITGPVIGLISGLILGLFAFIASRIIRVRSV